MSFWRPETYREQAKNLRVRAAEATSTEMRNDLEYIALQYELVAESIEPVEKERRGRNPKGNATGRRVDGSSASEDETRRAADGVAE